MNKKLNLGALLVLAALTFQSCGGDDAPVDVLITSHRKTGVFYSLNKSTGVMKKIFTASYAGDTLNEVRAFVYHPVKKLFYVSRNTFMDQDNGTPRTGYLFSLDPKTKVATLLNNNDGDGGAYAVWDAIVNWAVADDDSLVSVGDFNGDGNGIVKFGTDGGRSLQTKEVDICCGLGLLYNQDSGEMLVGSGENTDNGQIIIETISAAGVITNSDTITTFTDFPDDLSTDWPTLKGMVKDKRGHIYGILFDDDTSKTYFVSVDIAGKEITYISTLGVDNENQYNMLAFIPGRYAK